ncbi:MAG TPA: Xaa-Pro peptidase family protein [Solirubrobacteraceae bacterium]|jgi:Xaa-Pro aminopeptidase
MSDVASNGASPSRVERLAGGLGGMGVDAIVVQALVDVRYLTGFTGSSGLALIAADGQREAIGADRFLTDFRYVSQAAAQVPATLLREIVTGELLEAVPGLLQAGSGRLGFDDTQMTVREHRKLSEQLSGGWELVPCQNAVQGLRAVKDAQEIAKISAACKLADEALEAVLEDGLAGRTEREIASSLEQRMRDLGAEDASFSSIVASGPHGALPHAEPREEKIAKDVLVTIDWGARHEGYCSDCTRTFATGEGISAKAREVYGLVLAAQEAGLEAVKAGPSGKDVDAAARGVIEAGGHGEHFGHGLGHGVGLEIHEGPRLSRMAPSDPLVEGNIVTIEPGVYLPGELGVRIEDLVVVREGAQEVLTRLSKALTVVS